MKNPTRITTITIETERVFTFRKIREPQSVWCLACGALTRIATVSEAAIEVGVSELAIYQLLENRVLHFSEDSDGRVLVCLNSLMKELRGGI